MDDNTSKAIFTLMQKVVDKLDSISEKLNAESDIDLSSSGKKNNEELKLLISKSLNNQSILNKSILEIEGRIIESIKNNKVAPSINNYTEYSLIGQKASFKPKLLLLALFGLIIVWSSIKYIPSYLNEKSLLKKEKEDYEFFYNYVYLNQFKNSKNITADEFLNRIKQKDTMLINEYNSLFSTYRKEIRKKELNEELKTLNSNDR